MTTKLHTKAIVPSVALDEYGADIFRQTVEGMAARLTLDRASIPLVERYAMTMMTWRTAARHIAEEGIVVPAKRSRVPSVNLWTSIERKAAQEARTLEKLLGLAPASRQMPIAANPIAADGSLISKAEQRRRGYLVVGPDEDAA